MRESLCRNSGDRDFSALHVELEPRCPVAHVQVRYLQAPSGVMSKTPTLLDHPFWESRSPGWREINSIYIYIYIQNRRAGTPIVDGGWYIRCIHHTESYPKNDSLQTSIINTIQYPWMVSYIKSHVKRSYSKNPCPDEAGKGETCFFESRPAPTPAEGPVIS